MENKKRVIAAMSGGVDSSVSAAILKNIGYDVAGVFMNMGKHSNPTDARKVAKILNIPFYILNVQNEFKKRVVNYFIDEYKKGNTPNPCVECNRHIKFKFLMEKALQLKADYIATGHYARIQWNSKFKIKNLKLLVAHDKAKDQTYFLWTLNQKQLDKILFPIGDYTKTEVRAMAKKFRLPIAEKKDSQDICFTVPRRSFQAKAGPIITTEGKKVGKHKGLAFYTIGQRKGLPATPASWLAWRAGNPVYVIKKDLKKNTLIVSKSEKDLLQKEMIVKNVNWLSGKPYFGKCKVKIRSTAKPVLCSVSKIKNSKFKIIFNEPQRAITPGQSAVFYLPRRSSKTKAGECEVLGGGIID